WAAFFTRKAMAQALGPCFSPNSRTCPVGLPLSTILMSCCWNSQTSLERCLAVSVKPIWVNSVRNCAIPSAFGAVNSTNSKPSVPMGLCCSILVTAFISPPVVVLSGQGRALRKVVEASQTSAASVTSSHNALQTEPRAWRRQLFFTRLKPCQGVAPAISRRNEKLTGRCDKLTHHLRKSLRAAAVDL